MTKTEYKKMAQAIKDGTMDPCRQNFCRGCPMNPVCKGNLLGLSNRIIKKMIRGEHKITEMPNPWPAWAIEIVDRRERSWYRANNL